MNIWGCYNLLIFFSLSIWRFWMHSNQTMAGSNAESGFDKWHKCPQDTYIEIQFNKFSLLWQEPAYILILLILQLTFHLVNKRSWKD